MKLIKRTIAVLLCVLTLVSMFTVTTFAAETEIARFTLIKGEELWYNNNWDYTGHELTVQIDGYPARKAYCVDASLPAPNTGSNYRITTSTIDLANSTMSYQRYKNICKALYYCYGGAGYTSAQSNAFGVSTSSKTIVMDGVNVETYGHSFEYQKNPYTMDCMMGNVCYSIWGYNMLGATGKDLVYLLSHRVIAYLSGSPDWYYNLPPDGPEDSRYSYWELAVLECANAVMNAPDVPLSTNLYLCSFGSGYQRLLVPFDSVRLQLKKTSANPELTDGSNCYSLAGAVYNVYTDSACTKYIGNMTTNSTGYAYFGDGNANKGSNMPLQSYYAKEVKAPQGYRLDTKVYQFTNSGRLSDNVPIYEVKCSDIPDNDPAAVSLQKINSVTGEAVGIEGAEFTMSYYNGFYTAEELEGVTPTRQWVLKTNDKGRLRLSPDYLVSGDNFYYLEGNPDPALPLGTVTIQETKAPEGYLINPEVFVGQLKDSTSGISWFTTNELDPNGDLIVLEQPANGFAGVYKVDEDGNEVQGAVYGLYSSAETDANGMCLADNKLAEKTTGTDGLAAFDYGLEVGKEFYIQEISAPTGFELDKRVYSVTPTEDNTEIANPALVTVTENITTGDLQIVKTSEDGLVADVWFSIVDSNGKSYSDVSTGSDGTVTVNHLSVYNKDNSLINYTVKELGKKNVDGTYSLPAKYIPTNAQTQTLKENSVVTYNYYNELFKGDLKIVKTSDDNLNSDVWFSITASNGQKIDNVKTGTDGTVTVEDLVMYDNANNKISYTVKELGVLNSNGTYSIPVRYEANSETVTVEMDNSNVATATFHNTVKTGDLKVHKNSSDKIVEGVWFSVKSSNGQSIPDVVTGADGTVTVTDLPIYNENNTFIQYTVTELGFKNSDGSYYLPVRYISTEPQTKTLSEYATTPINCYFVNNTKTGKIELTKTSEDGEVADIYFNLSDKNGNDYGDFKTDKNGYIHFGTYELYNNSDSLINYVVTELGVKNTDGTYTVPYKYKTPSQKTFTLTEDETYSVSFANTLKTGSVTLTKYGTNNFKLFGASYKLYKADGTEVLLTATGTSSFIYSAKGSALTITTGTTGSFRISSLPQGDYYFIETKAPSGYSLVKEKIAFTISGEDNTTLNRTVDVTNTTKLSVPFTGGENHGNTMVEFGLLIVGLCAMVTVIVLYKKRKYIRKEK